MNYTSPLIMVSALLFLESLEQERLQLLSVLQEKKSQMKVS